MWVHKVNHSKLDNLKYQIASKMPRWLIYWCAVLMVSKDIICKEGDVAVPDDVFKYFEKHGGV